MNHLWGKEDRTTRAALPIFILCTVASPPLFGAPGDEPGSGRATQSLSLADAIAAGLVHNYSIRLAKVDRRVADEDIREAYASFFPSLDGTVRYTRTLLTPNPFAGSAAADLFSGFSAADWVTFNERVRAGGDGLDSTQIGQSCPGAISGGNLQEIPFSTYIDCVASGQAAVRTGAPPDPEANPFLVENNVTAGLALSQLIYSGSAFAAIDAANASSKFNEAQIRRSMQRVARDVASSYYGLQLARASVAVFQKSVQRTTNTVREVSSKVKEGVVPQFELLSQEVELANLETQLITARDGAQDAEDELAFIIGIPLETRLVLTDPLILPNPPPSLPVSLEDAVEVALDERPDLEASRQSVYLQRALEGVSFSDFWPELRLVADLTAVGNIPDDRRRIFLRPSSDPNALLTGDPFSFEEEERGIFDSDFWGTNFTAGLTLTWKLFDGFETLARYQKSQLETVRAQIQQEQLEQSIRREVAAEQRNVASALQRVQVQARNVERAELNYRHAELRVKEGVSTQLELRDASQQLDQSQFNRLQAIHDYLVARASFEVALGRSPVETIEEVE